MDADVEQRVSRHWSWAAVSFFLLIPVDLLTTLYATHLYGSEFEANPLMRWALEEGVATAVAVNILALALAVGIFYGLVEMIRRSSEPYDWALSYTVDGWLAFLFASGLFLFANNLAAIFLEESLIAVIAHAL